MPRTLFNYAAALSLLLGLAVTSLWLRSYSIRDVYCFAKPGGDAHTAQSLIGRLHVKTDFANPIIIATGGVSYTADRLPKNADWTGGVSGYPVSPDWLPGGLLYQRYGLGHQRPSIQSSPNAVGVMGFTTGHRLIVIPYWLPAALFALVPALWLRRRLFPPPPTPGRCAKCAYDLRATPHQCPECGTPAQRPPKNRELPKDSLPHATSP